MLGVVLEDWNLFNVGEMARNVVALKRAGNFLVEIEQYTGIYKVILYDDGNKKLMLRKRNVSTLSEALDVGDKMLEE